MTILILIIAGMFLPLFPLSMVFNSIFARVNNPFLRNVLLILWPQFGISILWFFEAEIPDWIVSWGLLTALLYALRLLAIREIGLWTSFFATSAWALLWITLQSGDANSLVYLYALGFSLPLILLILLSEELRRRFGAAYIGLYGGLAITQPRFSGVLVMVVLGVIATPVFPSFFTMLQTIITAAPVSLSVAISAGIVWLLWSWAGARMLHGLIVGPATQVEIPDLSSLHAWKYSGALIGLVVFSSIIIGEMP